MGGVGVGESVYTFYTLLVLLGRCQAPVRRHGLCTYVYGIPRDLQKYYRARLYSCALPRAMGVHYRRIQHLALHGIHKARLQQHRYDTQCTCTPEPW